MNLKNKTALVTGAGRGIGRAIGIALAKEGVRLVLVSRTLSELEETRDLLKPFSVPVFIFTTDVGSPQQIQMLFKELNSFCVDGLNFLINNAGYAPRLQFIEETDEAEWEKIININLSGVYRMCRAALPLLKKAGSGIVINIASIAGTSGYEKFTGLGAYSAAKAGVVTLTEVLAREVEKDHIGVFTISPGAVDTRMLRELVPQLKADLKPEDIAAKVVDILKGRVKETSGSNIVIADKKL